VPLFNPRIDNWSKHFVLDEFSIVGHTDVGRATATLLNMNDPERIQLRAELAALGQNVIWWALMREIVLVPIEF
jgi:hypothetical protein